MGRKFIFDPIRKIQVEVTDEQLREMQLNYSASLQKSATAKSQVNSEYSMGKMVMYTVDGVERIGKITNMAKNGNFFVISRVCGKAGKSGYQFSATDVDTVPVSDIKRALPNV